MNSIQGNKVKQLRMGLQTIRRFYQTMSEQAEKRTGEALPSIIPLKMQFNGPGPGCIVVRDDNVEEGVIVYETEVGEYLVSIFAINEETEDYL